MKRTFGGFCKLGPAGPKHSQSIGFKHSGLPKPWVGRRGAPGGIRKTKFPLKRRLETIDRIRKKYKLYEPSYVMFAGRLITEKGAEYLVKAADKINGPILIVGDGPQKEALKQMIKKSNLTNVTMLGFVGQDDLMQMYYLASVFVAPAVWDEPMGFTILEAMAASVPVVASRKVTFAIKDGVNGFHTQPRSSKDLTEKVNILLADYKLRRMLGKNARETVFNKYTWTEITKQFDKLYQSLL
jgi:glycosyltransferase involved in cell wall biosynthesis